MALRRPLALAALLSLSPAWALASAPARATLLSDPGAWTREHVVAIGQPRAGASAIEQAGSILALYLERGETTGAPAVRVSLVAPLGIVDRVDHFGRARMQVIVLLDEAPGGRDRLPAPLSGAAPFAWDRMLVLDPSAATPARVLGATGEAQALGAERARFHLDRGWLAASPERGAGEITRVAAFTVAGGREIDRLVGAVEDAGAYETKVAFMHHANQGLTYTTYFTGRPFAESSSGYDEILEAHESRNIPGNFHVAATLQTVAEWNWRNGDPMNFNAWLAEGVTEGWAGMIASAYGQPMTPFLQGAMNDWAINRDVSMVFQRYGYNAHVAWVPERVWGTPGQYPDAGVIDASWSRWKSHGIDAVILDDSPHCNGHNKHQIHFVPGNGLRVIPRDGDFTGKLHTGDGAGALAILQGEAASGNGRFRITVFADDWEQTAEVAGWETTYPNALETYEWMLDKCVTESAWLSTWKLDPAILNSDLNGDTFYPTNGTYGGIGDFDGYGGNNNAWYTDYAGYVPYANGGNGSGGCGGGGGNCKNHGQLWNDAHAALQAAPANDIREAGWYVLLTNLHETGWHDYLGGPLSGWQRQYAAKIKNAGIYAEAARWAGGLYGSSTGAFLSDIDNDGFSELVMHNDRVYAVFESIGGRCTHLFAKGIDYAYSVVGVDNAYWYGTEADYNDGNHVAALSDVGPNTQNDLYAITVDAGAGSTVQATLTHGGGLKKTIKLTLGQPYLDCVYRTGLTTTYVQSGWTPDLVSQTKFARMDRVYDPQVAYMGRRNPLNNATAAYVLGSGGASFNHEFSGTLMKGDEIQGTQKFEFYIYAGYASAPDGGGNVAELETLAAGLTDQLKPEAVSGTYFPGTRQLALRFDEPVRYNEIVVTGIAIDANNNGGAEVTLDGGTTVLTGTNAATITFQVSTSVHNAIQALTDKTQMRLLLTASAVKDVPGNTNAVLTNAGNVFVSYGPPTLITLDGRFDAAEWPACAKVVDDPLDSAWNSLPSITNEIQALYATWDASYLYLGIRGVVTGNSWLLYLDTDPGGPNGQTNLTAINEWERGVTLSAAGFKADWEFGAYQHQGAFDSQSFFKITSATTTNDSTAAILKAFDPNHNFALDGGSEIAIPWNTLYGLGGNVPVNAQLGLVSTLCYDPEPSGQAGGDQAPNNVSATAPALDNRVLVTIDGNGDGVPDAIDRAGPVIVSAEYGTVTSIGVEFNEQVDETTAEQPARYTVYETGNPGASVSVSAATLQGDGVTVVLTTSAMGNVSYTVVANGVKDESCFANASNNTSVAFAGPPVGVEPGAVAIGRLALGPPMPNPTTGRTTIEAAIPAGSSEVVLDLYDLAGRRVRRIFGGALESGMHRFVLDGRGADGARLAPGLFFVRLARGREASIQRLIVVP